MAYVPSLVIGLPFGEMNMVEHSARGPHREVYSEAKRMQRSGKTFVFRRMNRRPRTSSRVGNFSVHQLEQMTPCRHQPPARQSPKAVAWLPPCRGAFLGIIL